MLATSPSGTFRVAPLATEKVADVNEPSGVKNAPLRRLMDPPASPLCTLPTMRAEGPEMLISEFRV